MLDKKPFFLYNNVKIILKFVRRKVQNNGLNYIDGNRIIDIDSIQKCHGTAVDVFFVNADIFFDGMFIKSNLLLKDNKTFFVNDVPSGATVVDCSGYHILPGFADIHVHLREPGFEYKETIATATAAGLAGGFTMLCSMPNLNPVPDSEQNLNKQLDIIKNTAVCKVYPYGSITVGQNGGELSDLSALAHHCIGFSDDGRGLQSEDMMRRALTAAKKLNRPIVAHCEVGNPGASGVIHDGDYAKRNKIPTISSESEYAMVERDIQLAAELNAQLHICHVSTKESVAIIRSAKEQGVMVTAETAPHYLLLCDEELQDDGRFKMNPPIRSAADRDALIEGIVDGTIDAIATDHAPHSSEEKSKGLLGSAFGIVGLETSFATLYTQLVRCNIITLAQLVNLMSIKPRKIFGLDSGIKDGGIADFCIVNTEKKYVIDPTKFKSKGRATPFAGAEVYGEILYTHSPIQE